MIEESTKGLDFGALKDAIERSDAEALTGFYAEDAELRIAQAALPDGPAFELRGKGQIRRYLRAVCEQEMSCSVEEGEVVGEGRIELVEAISYPEGPPVSIATTLEVEGGLIVRHSAVVGRAARGEGGDR